MAWAIFCLVLGFGAARGQGSSPYLLCNTDFEDSIVVAPGNYTIRHQNAIPCWKTTAGDQMIEVWGAGFQGVQPHSGVQFIELNANMVSTIYQEFTPVANASAAITFAHRGRTGVDVMAVEIGPLGGPYTALGTFSAGNSAWVFNTVNFTFPGVVSGPYALRFNSISGAGGSASIGNFLDDISITLAMLNTTVVSASPACPGVANGAIQVNASGGNPPYQYQWSNGYTGGNSQTGLPGGIYTVSVSDVNGLTAVDTVTIQTVQPLAVSSQLTHPLCHGASTGSIVAGISGGTAPYSVAWTGTGTTGLQLSNVPAGVYPFTVTDANGCTTNSSATLTQPTALNVSSQLTHPLCHGLSTGRIVAGISGGTAPYSVAWTGTGTTGLQLNNVPAGVYPYTVTDANGCTTNSSATLTQPTALNVSSQLTHPLCHGTSDGSIVNSISGGTAPYTTTWNGYSTYGAQLNGLPGGVYPYTVTDAAGCTTGGSATLIQPQPFQVTVTAMPQAVCEGGQSKLTASGGVNYTWSQGASGSDVFITPTQTQSYTVIASNAVGCTQQASVQVQVDPLPALRVLADSICLGESYAPTYLASIASGSVISYAWDFGDRSLSPGSTPQHLYDRPGTFSVQCIATSDKQCTTTAEASVRVFQAPRASFDVNPAEGCAPVVANLINTSTSADGQIVSSTWTSPDAEDLGNGQFRYMNPGNHAMLLTVTTEFGCTHDTLVEAIATVHPRAVAGFDFYQDETAETSGNVVLTDRSLHAATWNWSFGDGNGSTESDPTHTFTGVGAFKITQIVDNGYGCPDTLVKTIDVSPTANLWVPDAFSPNTDGLNDIFLAIGVRIDQFSMDIFDRWGERVFASGNIEQGWDGTLKGQLAPEGVYIYAITYSMRNGGPQQLTGRVSLVR